MENPDHRVAIVGGGYAGCAAAVVLASRGVPVVLFESNTVPGGRARRVRSQGIELDGGQHILVGACSQLLSLMRLVGVQSQALLRVPFELRYADGFALRTLWLSAPFGLLGGLALAGGLPMRERVGAVAFLLRMMRAGFVLDKETTVGNLLASHAQDGRIGHYLWRPLCVAALNTPPDQASAQMFLTVLRDTLAAGEGASDLLLPQVDPAQLFPEPACTFIKANRGEVRFGEPVHDLAALRAAYPKVILAVAPDQLAAIAPQLALNFEYQPIYTCYLQYPATTKLRLPVLGFTHGIVQWAFDRGALRGEKGLIACVIGAQGDHQQMSQEELAQTCHRELVRTLGAMPPPDWAQVIAHERATIACTPGVQRPAQLTSLPGVILAGDFTDPDCPPSLEAAVRSGSRAAQLALGH